jgi:hypothetical protein
MAGQAYIPGSAGLDNGYNLTVGQAAQMQARDGKSRYPQYRNGATLVQLDVTITNSMATSLQIELFNYLRTQTKTFYANNGCNNYYPMGIDDSAGWPYNAALYANNVETFANPLVVNGYVSGLFVGNYVNYVDANANAGLPPDSKNRVYFDIYGNLIYQPGLVAGVQPTGNVVVSCNQMPYVQLFGYSGSNKIVMDANKFTFNAEAQTTQMAQTVYHKFFSSTGVANNQENYTPSTFFNEQNFQSNIITVPVDKIITDQWGIWYTILEKQSNVNTSATMTMFLWINNDDLRTNSNPRG